MEFDFSNLISVGIGGLLVFAGQWFASRQNAKVEIQKWRKEELKEVRRDIIKFRKERTIRIIEALDRASHRWDAKSYFELLTVTGAEFEAVDTASEEYSNKRKEQKQKYVSQLADDISAASTIHDDSIRELVTNVLWQSPNSEVDAKYNDNLREAYLKLENWIFNPIQDYGSPNKEK
jgi:hypothetical protein